MAKIPPPAQQWKYSARRHHPCVGLPGSAINPFYAAMQASGGIDHILARHDEGSSHMADGYSRAQPGNIGVCLGTCGPGAPT